MTRLQQSQAVDRSRDYWDIMKGIGIVCVVFGHSCTNFANAISFVYLFHLVVFFFVSGYLWSEEKYGDKPWLNFAARVKSNYMRYVTASVVIVLLHNYFISVGMLVDQPVYSVDNMMIAILTSLIMNCTELFSSSMWFVPLLILGSTFFAEVVAVSRKISEKLRHTNGVKYVMIICLSVLSGYLGVYATTRNWGFNYNIQIALLIVPIYAIAYFAKILTHGSVESYAKWYIALPLGIGLWFGMERFGWQVDLGMNRIGEPLLFYGISIVGIYFCLGLASLIMKIGFARKGMALIGRYSFEIMAYHLLIVKLVDVIYAMLIGEENPAVYGVFTNAYAVQLWWVYLLLSIILPCMITWGVQKTLNHIQPVT